MTTHSRVYRVSGPRVIFENVDDELILVHMERGTYYSTDDVGALIWSRIESGASAEDLRATIASRYDADPGTIADAVADFLARLLREELVVVEDVWGPSPTDVPQPEVGRRPFQPPVLNVYQDMQDMLSLDPIHDVEAAGWPVPRIDGAPVARSENAP
jgi:hypothetical protein